MTGISVVETAVKEIKRLSDIGSGRADMIKLDPRLITIEPDFNPRDASALENTEHIAKLKASIREHGVQNPLWVRWDTESKSAILVDGGCRLKAVMQLIEEGVEILTVPVVQKTAGNVADRLVLALTANEGKPLTQTEVGTSYQRLVNYGWDLPRIAQRVGKTERYVTDSIALSSAPDEVKAMVNTGVVSKDLAIKTIRTQGDKAAVVLEAKVKVAKSEGKKQAKSEKKAPIIQVASVSKLEQIAIIMQDFENMDADKRTQHELINILADISDVLESDLTQSQRAA